MVWTNKIFTQFHVMEYLLKNGECRATEIINGLETSGWKVYDCLQKLRRKGFVNRLKKEYKNHKTYFYSLSEYAERWRFKNGMLSYLDKCNPAYSTLKKLSLRYKEATRTKKGIIPSKKLGDFYGKEKN